MNFEYDRKSLRSYIGNQFLQSEIVLACWEGGSKATGHIDIYSDLDIVVVVNEKDKEHCLDLFNKIICTRFKIRHKWEVRTQGWHGGLQGMYSLEDMPDYFFIDFTVFSKKEAMCFLDVPRHGKADFIFNKLETLIPFKPNTDKIHSSAEKFLKEKSDKYIFIEKIIRKEIQRKNTIDVIAFYKNLLGLLVEAWGVEYRPERYDFGFRYLKKDLPQEKYRLLEKLMLPSDVNDIAQNLEIIRKLYKKSVLNIKNSISNYN